MVKWLKKLFSHKEVIILELPLTIQLPEPDPNMREALIALGAHPGFRYLTNKLRFEHAAIESRLKKQHHENLREVDFLQVGLFWTGWLQRQIDKELRRKENQSYRISTEAELSAFNEVSKAIEQVGK